MRTMPVSTSYGFGCQVGSAFEYAGGRLRIAGRFRGVEVNGAGYRLEIESSAAASV